MSRHTMSDDTEVTNICGLVHKSANLIYRIHVMSDQRVYAHKLRRTDGEVTGHMNNS